MKRSMTAVAVAAALCLSAGAATAGPASDQLGLCMVKATTPADRTDLMIWIFGAIGLHPAARPYFRMTDAEHDQVTRKAAGLFERLLIVDCRADFVAAIKADGVGPSVQQGFSRLGQVAMQGLSTDPAVAASLGQLAAYIDEGKFTALAGEAAKP